MEKVLLPPPESLSRLPILFAQGGNLLKLMRIHCSSLIRIIHKPEQLLAEYGYMAPPENVLKAGFTDYLDARLRTLIKPGLYCKMLRLCRRGEARLARERLFGRGMPRPYEKLVASGEEIHVSIRNPRSMF